MGLWVLWGLWICGFGFGFGSDRFWVCGLVWGVLGWPVLIGLGSWVFDCISSLRWILRLWGSVGSVVLCLLGLSRGSFGWFCRCFCSLASSERPWATPTLAMQIQAC